MLTIDAQHLRRLKLKLIVITALICISITGWFITTFWIFYFEKKIDYQQSLYHAMDQWYRENTIPIRK